MDRHNWNFPNADYNNHYNLAYQEHVQYISQPEAGQTSGGVAASGPSWSYPTPSQPQPYPDFNFPQWIPPSLGEDLEYLLRTPQPTPWENIIQNDAPPEPSNAQPAVKKRRRRKFTEVKEQFLASLDKYAHGYTLDGCSTTIDLNAYLNDAGYLRPKGIVLYNKLEQKDKDLVDQALADRQDRKGSKEGPVSDKVRSSFLEGLDAYANGALLRDCSATLSFDVYVTSKGTLHKRGEDLYNCLEQGDKDRIDDALRARREIPIDDTFMDDFLGGLEAYSRGAPLTECFATVHFSTYVTSDGRLLPAGKRLRKKLAGREEEILINKALADRKRITAQQISGDLPDFMKALEPYSNGLDLLECGIQSGLTGRLERYLTPEGGLTAKGELLIENLPPDEQLEVLNMVGRRKQFTDPSAQPVPESPPWQLPSSMQDMRGMDQAAMVDPIQSDAMVDPMQTEAMWATAWQLTGQAVPGPSAPAESPIPYYDSEAIWADFQHPLWPIQTDNTERTGPPHQPGDRGPYADQYPWRGV
jgi:hypothetical protein